MEDNLELFDAHRRVREYLSGYAKLADVDQIKLNSIGIDGEVFDLLAADLTLLLNAVSPSGL